ncbi:MAG: Stp1/IreP family PP2C-type Ser/Thr phosphatase [Eubacterium sp.]|nr:Stp1/IreP family PP2C-type Ser/Thr phosphatase [Eubacterium sp.]
MEVGFKTDKGKQRSNNEDACYVMPRSRIFVVADGVGGSNSGEIASRTAVNGIRQYVEEHPISKTASAHRIKKYFNDCLKEVNFTILDSSQRFEENRGMATTVVIAYIVRDRMYVMNVGDSRAYILRKGKLTQITEDHTYVNSLVKAGIITPEEAEFHENKNMITRAVGADYKIEPDFFTTKLRGGDIILLCTDGLYGEVSNEEIIAMLSSGKTMGETCYDLIETANENGGNDNITLICLKLTEDDLDEQ